MRMGMNNQGQRARREENGDASEGMRTHEKCEGVGKVAFEGALEWFGDGGDRGF